MKKIVTFLTCLLLIGSVAKAQNFDAGGSVINPSTITAFDMFNISQSQAILSTARSAALAGAMTSLGADPSTMSINPAGMGMYRHNEVAFTPMMGFARAKNGNASSFESNSKNRFGIANFSMVARLRESGTGVTAINMGLAYNRLADFNYQTSFANVGQPYNNSIADVFAGMLHSGGISRDYLKGNYNGFGEFMWERIDPTYWGAVLGYKTGLINAQDTNWKRDMIAPDATVDGYNTIESQGSLGEWVWSLGMNFGSKFYLGFSLSASLLNREVHTYYGEGYRYSSEPEIDYRMDYFNYDQISKMKGTGITFKIGAIYRPIENLRIGVAFHTPTYYNVTYSYSAGMTSRVKALNNVDDYTTDSNAYIDPPFSERTIELIDDGDYSWRFTTPMRLMVGVSYTVAKQFILSVDYQRDFNTTMRMKNSPYGALYKDYIKHNFKGSNALRVGAEWRFIPQMAVRMGYSISGSGVADKNAIYSSPVIYNTQYMTSGLGIALSKHFSIDVAYIYSSSHLTPYKAFYGYDNSLDYAAPTVNSTINRHTAMLTFAIHF